jgi:hypothetical protein
MAIHNPPHIPRTHASYDLTKEVFLQMNTEIEECIDEEDLVKLQRPFQFLSQLSPAGQSRYTKEGSYYPALSPLMQRGEFQKISKALSAIKAFSQFETPKIQLCRLACSLQLGESDLEFPDLHKIGALVEEMIQSSTHAERRAYKSLRSILNQPRRASRI